MVAGMNMNVWDVSDPIRELIRSRRAVDDRRLADPDVPLEPLDTRDGQRLERLASEAPDRLRLHDAGVSIWLDTLSRELLESGEFAAPDRRAAP